MVLCPAATVVSVDDEPATVTTTVPLARIPPPVRAIEAQSTRRPATADRDGAADDWTGLIDARCTWAEGDPAVQVQVQVSIGLLSSVGAGTAPQRAAGRPGLTNREQRRWLGVVGWWWSTADAY